MQVKEKVQFISIFARMEMSAGLEPHSPTLSRLAPTQQQEQDQEETSNQEWITLTRWTATHAQVLTSESNEVSQ